MTADLLDQGTSRHTAPQIAEALARLGTEFNAATEEDYSLASVGSLSTNADALLDLFSEVVMQPAFADAEIARARAQALARIQKRVDDANGFADAAFADYLFGDHPYSRTELGTATAMAEIKKKNIIMNYKRYYRPNNSILAVVGKIGPELRQRVEKVFGAWQPQEVAPPAFPPPPKIEGLSIRLVEKPGIQQAQIRIGQVGIRRQDEDFLALRVANMVLGAPFTSRLMKQIRVKLGLTYSISSAFEARLAEGPFVISTFTKPQTTGKAVEETLKVLREFRDGGVAADEVELAKSYLKGLFPQAIETAERFAQNLMLLRLYGVPDTYLSTYAQAMDKIQVADVNRVIQKHFDPKNLRIVVYASADVLPQLKPLGAVEEKGAAEILR
jgi:zinc protease